MLRPERSIEQSTNVDIHSQLRRGSVNQTSIEDSDHMNSGPFNTTMNSPVQRDTMFPKAVGSTKNANGRTAVNFFRSVHNNSGNVFTQNSASRDSGRGLGGGWNGGSHIVEESPQRERGHGHHNSEMPGLTYLQVKVSY